MAQFLQFVANRFMNKFMYWLSFKGMWTFLGAPINKFRKEIGLPSQGAYDLDAAPMLCMYSKEVSTTLRLCQSNDPSSSLMKLVLFEIGVPSSQRLA